MKKCAVVLFNLGGPSDLKSVRPFLFNLFNDPYIIQLPSFLRYLVARLISWRRAPIAQEIYSEMGGKSPIVEQTDKQAKALEKKLGPGYKVFFVMRYWHPRADEVLKKVRAYNPEEVVLLPLYPQFSSTTSLSSLDEWAKTQQWLKKDQWQTRIIRSYSKLQGLISYFTKAIESKLKNVREISNCRVLFSAHGLPEKVISAGDPYQKQIIETAQAIQQNLPQEIDFLVTYQSRVGPLKWLDPYTDQEIIRAGQEGKELIVVPIAFVSEHSETLVELDIEYRELAEKSGVVSYHRVNTPQDDPEFIASLADMIKDAHKKPFESGCYPCLRESCPKKLRSPKVCCMSR
ncbi:MAG: ferrochelatase [Rickettsiales bacterium]|nr:ferrochelatase [Rickettsiales bacterium]|tara:strand:+ start:67669 stop:68706 length:1038 start_codon:yes stop_codon:yes gene_type:complete